MDVSAPTIPARKQAFITAQITLLSQPVAPSRAWRATNDASNTPIRRRMVDDAVFEFNRIVDEHCQRAYAPQASRNLAERISTIYIGQMDRREGGADDVDGGVGKEVDLANDGTIESLPVSWPSEEEAVAKPEDAQTYARSVSRLAELSKERQQVQLRMEKLRRLQSAIQPLRTSESGKGVQENLVTRAGAMERELEKMRDLLGRVAGRVDRLRDASANARSRDLVDVDELRTSRKRAVDDFLADSKVFPG
ncbi:kinetochore protein fta4, putative [Cordyceps militaris CM01]|uniref:Kinetochore protein fta4, putative n=1 Tax=Cordyceps militaris (strain CM01) TaxID=983644 RepID=G3JKT8_CORMM|nr:kinetochore protein fta4, putative [Cordyceps militaris CM01]EGX90312.1 kinetochore protein fta4, putative [Cordyceps militaris CM01]